MKSIVLLSLLSISFTCSGMSWLKNIKKKFETTFAQNDEPNAMIAQPKEEETKSTSLSEKLLKIQDTLNKGSENIKKERLLVYQSTQKQNINGIIFPLFAAGIFRLNANQSHPAGDAYFNFNMATMFSLGISAAFAYKFCTTTLPVQKLEHKK